MKSDKKNLKGEEDFRNFPFFLSTPKYGLKPLFGEKKNQYYDVLNNPLCSLVFWDRKQYPPSLLEKILAEPENERSPSEIYMELWKKEPLEWIAIAALESINFIERSAFLRLFPVRWEDIKNKEREHLIQATRLFCQYGFYELNLRKIKTLLPSYAKGFIELMKDMGFVAIGTFREHYLYKGTYYDGIYLQYSKNTHKSLEIFPS